MCPLLEYLVMLRFICMDRSLIIFILHFCWVEICRKYLRQLTLKVLYFFVENLCLFVQAVSQFVNHQASLL